MNIIVPAFWPPPTFGVLPDWTPIHRAVPTATIAVLNISLDKLDPLSLTTEDFFNNTGWRDYAPALVQQAQQAGLEVLGYVPTDGATAVNNWPLETKPPGTTEEEWAKKPYRTLAHVKKYVDLWYDWLGLLRIDGIFFDEGPQPYRFKGGDPSSFPPNQTVAPAVRQFYQEIYNHVKSKQSVPGVRGATVMLNASEFQDEWVMGVADIVELFEGTADKYETGYQVQPWSANYPANHIYHLIHTCSTTNRMIEMVQLSRTRNAGNVYVFDGTSSAYNSLPLLLGERGRSCWGNLQRQMDWHGDLRRGRVAARKDRAVSDRA